MSVSSELARLHELELEVQRARLDAGRERQRADNLYNKLRALENGLRRLIVVGERVDTDALLRLRQRIPNKARPSLRELRTKARR